MATTKLTANVENIQTLADQVTGQASTTKQTFDKGNKDTKAYINDVLTVEIDELDAENMKKTGVQTIDGEKTFTTSPIVPTPTADTQAATKGYVDSQYPINVPDDSLTELKMAGDMKKDITGGVTAYDTFSTHLSDKEPHANIPKARVYNSVDQSIANNTLTSLTFNSESYDNDTIHAISTNPSRLTCKTAGVYDIKANVIFVSNAAGYRRVLLLVNGGSYAGEVFVNAASSSVTSISVSGEFSLAVNDYVEVKVQQSSGGALDVKSGEYTTFSMRRVG